MEPHGRSVNEKGLNFPTQRIFERAVSWFLTLCGFRAIWLGEKELWRDPVNNAYQLGTADILAFSERDNTLTVVQCSTATPSQKEINDLASVVERIRRELSKSYPVEAPLESM